MYRLLIVILSYLIISTASGASVIAVLGDSISAGYGLKNGDGWVTLLQNRLSAQGYNYKVINASITGDTTSGGLTRLPAILRQYKPAIVIVELGGNDGLRGLSVSQMQTNLDDIVTSSLQNKSKVLLLGMQLPPNYGLAFTKRFADVYASISRQRKTALVPFFLEGLSDDKTLFQADQIHPNAEAQALLLENVWTYLKPML